MLCSCLAQSSVNDTADNLSELFVLFAMTSPLLLLINFL